MKSLSELIVDERKGGIEQRFIATPDGKRLIHNPNFIPPPANKRPAAATIKTSTNSDKRRDLVMKHFPNWYDHPRLLETKGKMIDDWHEHFDGVPGTERIGHLIDMHKELGLIRGPGGLKDFDGIGLIGPPGVGKTSALTALLRHRRGLGDVCLFVSFNQMVENCASGYAPKYADSTEMRARAARVRVQKNSVDTLVWDDIGRRSLSDTAEEMVHSIIDTIYIRSRTDSPRRLLWTTNVDTETLKQNLGHRIWDRLSATTAVVPIEAESVRGGVDNFYDP